MSLNRFPDSMNSERTIEQHASLLWVFFTFIISYLLIVLQAAFEVFWLPDFIALTLIYWCVHRPRSMSMTAAFACGILVDVVHGSALGQQALSYVCISYFAFLLHRRLPWFGLFGQALHILPLLLISQVLVMLVRLWFDGLWPGWSWFLQSAAGAVIWPIWSLLIAPKQDAVAKTL